MDLSKLRSVAVRAAQKVYPRLGLRDSDIILASFPKSGNTWMRFIWANMVSLEELGGQTVNFEYLDSKLIAEYDSHSYGEVEFDCLPRVIKTHRAYENRAFGGNRVIYIIRHPGDVAVSFHEYLRAQVQNDIGECRIGEFIRDERYGVPAWCRHVRSWYSEADIVVKYEELKADPEAAVHRILQEFGLSHIDETIIEKAVERSSFDKLRDIEEQNGRPRQDQFVSSYRFMRSGTTGEWNDRFDEEDINYLINEIKSHGLEKIYKM